MGVALPSEYPNAGMETADGNTPDGKGDCCITVLAKDALVGKDVHLDRITPRCARLELPAGTEG